MEKLDDSVSDFELSGQFEFDFAINDKEMDHQIDLLLQNTANPHTENASVSVSATGLNDNLEDDELFNVPSVSVNVGELEDHFQVPVSIGKEEKLEDTFNEEIQDQSMELDYYDNLCQLQLERIVNWSSVSWQKNGIVAVS